MLNISDSSALGQVIHSSIILFFLVFGAIAVALSIGLIVRSESVFRIFRALNSNISTRRSFRTLAILRDSSQPMARYQRWLASFIIVGAAYAIYGVAGLDDEKVAAMLGWNFPMPFVVWVVESARLSLIALSGLSLAVGIMLSFFPQALAAIEKPVNQWISTRVLVQDLERMHFGFDRLVVAAPKAVGWVILFPALAVMLDSGYLLA